MFKKMVFCIIGGILLILAQVYILSNGMLLARIMIILGAIAFFVYPFLDFPHKG